jgi:hypothetical protein
VALRKIIIHLKTTIKMKTKTSTKTGTATDANTMLAEVKPCAWASVKKKPKEYSQIICLWEDEGELIPLCGVFVGGKYLNLEEWHNPNCKKKDKEIVDVRYWAYLPSVGKV